VQEYTLKHKVAVLAYCLMNNHIHLILQPTAKEGLQKVLKPLHMRKRKHHYYDYLAG
jgi:putative transposase